MAVRFTSDNNQQWVITSNLPDGAIFSFMCWAYITTDRNNYSIVFVVRGLYHNPQLATNGTGTEWCISTDSTESSGYGVNTGEWHHIAWVRRSFSDNEVWVDGILRVDAFDNVQDQTPTSLGLGNFDNTTTYGFNGRLFAAKLWEAGLSQSEIEAEVYSLRPRRLANLYGFWPLFPGSDAERTRDYSGNGHHWTAGSTSVTDEDSAPVSWGAKVLYIPRVGAGGTSSTTLTVQDSSHAHTADNISLVQTSTLTVQESLHAHLSDNINLVQVTTVVVQESTHGHVADNINLVQIAALVVQESSHAHITESPVLVQTYALSVQETIHAHTADNITLTGIVITLTVQKSTHAHSNESHSEYISRMKSLFGSSMIGFWALDETSGNISADLSGSGCSGTYASEIRLADRPGAFAGSVVPRFPGTGTFPYAEYYSIGNLYNKLNGLVGTLCIRFQDEIFSGSSAGYMAYFSSDTVDWIYIYKYPGNYVIMQYYGDNQVGEFTNPSIPGWNHAAISWDVTGTHKLVGYLNGNKIGEGIQTGTWAGNMSAASIGGSAPLYFTGWVGDVILLNRVATSSEVFATYTYNVSLSQTHVLQVQDSSHAHLADNIILTSPSVTLTVQESSHGHTTENAVLTQIYSLAVQESLHNHTTDNIALTQIYGMFVQESLHSHLADNITLSQFTFLRPNADTYTGGWTTDTGATTNLYQAVDEITASDSDYIQSEQNPASSPVVMALSSGNDPFSSSDHILRYRYALDGAGVVNLTVELRQGYVNESSQGTLIAQWVHNDIGTIVTAEQTLNAVQADSISDYTQLFVRIVADKV